MTDIVERLRVRRYSRTGDTELITLEAAAEIERLRARLEIDPSHPYDGIYARDETIRQQDKQIERLRAALDMFSCDCTEDSLCRVPHACPNYVARAALEGKR